VHTIEIAGSYRRRRETVGDLDIVVACHDGAAVMDRLVAYEDVDDVVSHGTTRSTIRVVGGLQVDVRAVDPDSFGAALVYFTGSKAHNVALRQRAIDRGWKLNEYGLFDGDTPVAGRTEQEVYRQLGLAWIPPELREDQGEIDAAAQGALPRLVTVDDIRGGLHVHTTWSDGRDTLEAMAAAARERSYEYLAVTDHGPRVRVANGLDPERLRQQARAIEQLDAELGDLTLLKGCEVDILADGSLDLEDDVLAGLDVVVCSIHYNLNLSRAEQTERVLRAMDNPHCMIWGHPTAREIGKRDPIDVDLGACLAAAAERGIQAPRPVRPPCTPGAGEGLPAVDQYRCASRGQPRPAALRPRPGPPRRRHRRPGGEHAALAAAARAPASPARRMSAAPVLATARAAGEQSRR